MRLIATAFAVLLLLTGAAHCNAATLDRVRQRGVVSCGSAIRPGLAFPNEDHTWHGLHIELCRAVAAAVLGDPDKIAFNGYALRQDFERTSARTSTDTDDLAFMTATEIFTNHLFDGVLPGPTVYRLATKAMVWDASPIHHVSDIGRTMVCDEPGTGPERNLVAYAKAHRWNANISGWMELEEMMDAYDVGRCPAIIGEETALGAIRISAAHGGHPSRILPEPLAMTPIMAVSAADDPQWAIIVRWTIETVLANQTSDATLDIPGQSIGLDKDWQTRVRAIGTYPAIYERTLGNDTALELPPGANATWPEGGLLVAPGID
jgi:general L-amino acid transport system substrate-binding protein